MARTTKARTVYMVRGTHETYEAQSEREAESAEQRGYRRISREVYREMKREMRRQDADDGSEAAYAEHTAV
jgi:putative hemolysin